MEVVLDRREWRKTPADRPPPAARRRHVPDRAGDPAEIRGQRAAKLRRRRGQGPSIGHEVAFISLRTAPIPLPGGLVPGHGILPVRLVSDMEIPHLGEAIHILGQPLSRLPRGGDRPDDPATVSATAPCPWVRAWWSVCQSGIGKPGRYDRVLSRRYPVCRLASSAGANALREVARREERGHHLHGGDGRAVEDRSARITERSGPWHRRRGIPKRGQDLSDSPFGWREGGTAAAGGQRGGRVQAAARPDTVASGLVWRAGDRRHDPGRDREDGLEKKQHEAMAQAVPVHPAVPPSTTPGTGATAPWTCPCRSPLRSAGDPPHPEARRLVQRGRDQGHGPPVPEPPHSRQRDDMQADGGMGKAEEPGEGHRALTFHDSRRPDQAEVSIPVNAMMALH